MKLVLKWKEEIKLFTSELNYEALVSFIGAEYGLKDDGIEITYVDQDGDNITVASQQDLLLLTEYFTGKEYVKLSISGEKKEVAPIQAQTVVQAKEEKAEDAAKKKKKNSQKANKEKNPSKPKEAAENNNGKEKKSDKKEKVDKSKPSDSHSDQIKRLLNITVAQMVDQRIKALLPCMRQQLQNPPRQKVESNIVHQSLSCSLCGVKPIIGVRYDCPSCVGFSICSYCEDISIHEHNLLKIRHISEAKVPKTAKNIDKICKIMAKQALQHNKNIEKMETKEQLKEKQKLQEKEKEKEAKRYLSQLLGQQPNVFNDFVKKNKKSSIEEIVKLYTESIQLSADDYKERLVDLQARRLAKKFKKQAECYTDFVREHLYFDFNTVLEATYKFSVEKKQKKVVKVHIADVAKDEVKAPLESFASNHSKVEQPEPKIQIAEPVRKNSSNLRKAQIVSQLKGEKLQALKLMIEFFGARNQAAYQRFIEENEKHGKDSIVQKWADRFSVIQP